MSATIARNPIRGLKLVSGRDATIAAGRFGDEGTARTLSLYLLIKADLLEDAVDLGRGLDLPVGELTNAARRFASDAALLTKALASEEVRELESKFTELGIPEPVERQTLLDMQSRLETLVNECQSAKHIDPSADLVARGITVSILPILAACLKDDFCYITDRVALGEGGRLLQRSLILSQPLPRLSSLAFDIAVGLVSLAHPVVGGAKVALDSARFVSGLTNELASDGRGETD